MPEPDLFRTFSQLGVALGLGLLVGLQREHVAARLAGLRTFPLVTIFGFVSALLAIQFGGVVVAGSLIVLCILIAAGNYLTAHTESIDAGITTEVALVVMFAVGALLAGGQRDLGIVIGAGVAVLLQFKGEMRGLVARLGPDDLKAIMQFVLVVLVILPALPDRTYGPYQVLNPRQIWWMVVLVVGIDLAGYMAGKFVGAKHPGNSVLHGVLGGLVSSTATTVTYARRTRTQLAAEGFAALVVLVASTVVFLRVLGVLAAVSTNLFTPTVELLGFPLLAGVITAAVKWRQQMELDPIEPTPRNPAELWTALFFAGLYALVLLVTAAMRAHFGNPGLLAVAALAGLSDLDAVTLSTSHLVNVGQLEASAGAQAIGVAVLSNMAFKIGIVAALGTRILMLSLLRLFAPIVLSLVVAFLVNG